jgi:ATP-binding cassette, subfamily G (WHITE), member 2, SNQ2
MPTYVLPHRNEPHGGGGELDRGQHQDAHVFVTAEAEDTITELHRVISRQSKSQEKGGIDEKTHVTTFEDFERYLLGGGYDSAKPEPVPLSVCFKSVTTYGRQGGPKTVKTLKDAVWRTLTGRDIYEATLRRIISPDRVEDGQALIKDFSGVVRNGQMML